MTDGYTMLGPHQLINKRYLYDESPRVSFLLRYPRASADHRANDALVSNVDLMSAVADLAGVPLPAPLPG